MMRIYCDFPGCDKEIVAYWHCQPMHMVTFSFKECLLMCVPFLFIFYALCCDAPPYFCYQHQEMVKRMWKRG